MTRSARQAGDPALARIERVVSRIREVYGREAIAVDLERDASPDVTDSSVFGPPFLPDGEEIPRDWRGEQLTLLAQVNLTQLPANSVFPPAGILQVWLECTEDDGAYGMGDPDFSPTAQKIFRVRFFPDGGTSLASRPRAEVEALYHPDCSQPPIEIDHWDDVTALRPGFSIIHDAPSPAGYDFEPLFVRTWNTCFPDEPLARAADLNVMPYDDYMRDIRGMLDASGHRLGGYPGFTQQDPRLREDGGTDFDQLLLQLGSIADAPLCWGDCGVGVFLIPSENLSRADFSRVFYTWDCG